MAKSGHDERAGIIQQVQRVVEAEDAWVKAQREPARGQKSLTKREQRLIEFEYDDARDELNYHAILRLLRGH